MILRVTVIVLFQRKDPKVILPSLSSFSLREKKGDSYSSIYAKPMYEYLVFINTISNNYLMSMPTAFVLINYEFGAEKETINKLKTIPGVIEASEVNGVYDIIIKITSDNLDNLKDTIRRRIRTIDTIRSTMTLIAVE